MAQGLITTSVGSLPKPDYLIKARAQRARDQIGVDELKEIEHKATESWIRRQEDIGIDILVDGEMYRGDMVTYFAENMDGFEISGLVRSYGNRYYRKPIAVGPVGFRSGLTVEWWQFAQGLTDRPVKGMLTGPYTIADWSFNEHYPTREAFVLDLARAVRDEARALEEAGCRHIQIDEPAISTRPDEMELARRALEVVTDGLNAYTYTHICYGDFEAVADELVKLPVDNFDLELANSEYDLLGLLKAHGFSKDLSAGVVDVHSHTIEPVEDVKRGIEHALGTLDASRLYIDPDCGLKTRTEEEAIAKLKVIVDAVRQVKKEQRIA